MAGRTYYSKILKKDPCIFCGRVTKMTVEHIHPRASGGSNHWANLGASCATCNGDKSDYSLLGFLLVQNLTRDERKRRGVMGISPHKATFSQDLTIHDMPDMWHSPIFEYYDN